MSKHSVGLGMLLLVLLLGMAGCADTSTTTTIVHPVTPRIQTASITIPRARDVFLPFIVPVQPHTIVTWHNDDSIPHTFTTTPDKSSFLNPQSFSLTVPAGKAISFSFSQSGIYHYYETAVSSWNSGLKRVAAKKQSATFPLAMDGVIWVQGDIAHIPAIAINHVLAGHDDFATEFVAISAGGSVTWHNFDEDPHFIGFVPYLSAPLNPEDPGLYRIAGTQDTPGGASATVIFDKPGLYYYYCRNHDIINQEIHRVQPLMKASEYPVPMEGFVLVVQADA